MDDEIVRYMKKEQERKSLEAKEFEHMQDFLYFLEDWDKALVPFIEKIVEEATEELKLEWKSELFLEGNYCGHCFLPLTRDTAIEFFAQIKERFSIELRDCVYHDNYIVQMILEELDENVHEDYQQELQYYKEGLPEQYGNNFIQSLEYELLMNGALKSFMPNVYRVCGGNDSSITVEEAYSLIKSNPYYRELMEDLENNGILSLRTTASTTTDK